MAKHVPDHLWQRGRKWYLKLGIPRPLRGELFMGKGGKPLHTLVEDMGYDYVAARTKADRRVAAYREIFARLRAGEKLTRAQIDNTLAIEAEVERLRREMADEIAASGGVTVRFVTRAEGGRMEAEARSKAGMTEETFARQQEAYRLGAMDAIRKLAKQEGIDVDADEVESAILGNTGETISQAAEHWFAEMKRPGAAVKATTLDGHRLRVKAFIDHAGDVPLAGVTRQMASDWLAKVAAGRSNRTTNNYATTLASLFKSARQRGRFEGDNPFEAQKRKAGGESYEAFEPAELQTLFASLPREIAPTRHSPETALPWAALIGAYTGMRLEEIAQLTVADVQTRGSNGGTVIVFDIHNGDSAHHLKNASSARAVPLHSALFRAGLLDYVKALPQDGLLFPGLKRRSSKGGKIGARIGELFRKRLVALGIKRDGLCFHSFRHTVAGRLESAAISQTDAARVLGHTVPGMSYGVYSTGPGLKRLAAVVEAIEYSDVPALAR